MQLQETSGVHDQQPQNSSKDSQNTEKSLHVRAKDEKPKLMFVTFGLSGCSAIKPARFCEGYWERWENAVCSCIYKCGLKLDHVKSRSHNINNNNIKSHHPLQFDLMSPHFKQVFGRCVLQAEEEKGHPE